MGISPAIMPGTASQAGLAIASARKASGLTQEELAREAAISVSLLRKIEQGRRRVTPGVRAALDTALGAPGARAPGRIASAVPLLRQAMDQYDIPADPPPCLRELPELAGATASATMLRLASEYAALADMLPGLITELTVHAHTSGSRGKREAFALLALAYRSADAIADKHGWHDMSGRAVELIRWAAARAADPLLEAMSAYVRAELFFTGTHARTGLRMLDEVISTTPSAVQIPQLAMRGALAMRAAVLAAHAGQAQEAADRMGEARAAAAHIPDGVYHGTAFGPSSVRVHELALAVESYDIGRAVQLAGQWQPGQQLPAERRSHFHVEAARAYSWAGKPDQAINQLWQARHAAPQHTRFNPAVAETVQALIRAGRKPALSLRQLANWIAQPSAAAIVR